MVILSEKKKSQQFQCALNCSTKAVNQPPHPSSKYTQQQLQLYMVRKYIHITYNKHFLHIFKLYMTLVRKKYKH